MSKQLTYPFLISIVTLINDRKIEFSSEQFNC